MKLTNLAKCVVVAVVAAGAAGCGSVGKTDYMLSAAQLRAQPQLISATPNRTSVELSTDTVSGRAQETVILFFFRSGDRSSMSFLGAGLTSTLTNLGKIAASRAIDEAGADGLYVLRQEIESDGFWPIYTTRSAIVHGKPVTLITFGPENPDTPAIGRLEVDGRVMTIEHNEKLQPAVNLSLPEQNALKLDVVE